MVYGGSNLLEGQGDSVDDVLNLHLKTRGLDPGFACGVATHGDAAVVKG